MSLKTMETEVLKAICASQGAVNTVDLMSNLGFGDSTTQIISNREKFAACCPFGQPKVVARTSMKLCRDKTCTGACRGLHLCKNFLFSGSCHFESSRRGCTFSHDLNSCYNQFILQEHELEGLSRTELLTLLLQSDKLLLPAICYDYNNGPGEFGKCQDPNGCKRVHICEKFLNRDCNCPKTHDFNAPQPLKILQDRGVPDTLIHCMKSAYANKEALRYADKQSDAAKQGNKSAAATNSDGCCTDGSNLPKKVWPRGRGRGGFRGNRGNRGGAGNRGNRGNRRNQPNRPLQPGAENFSTGDIVDDIDDLDLYCSDAASEGSVNDCDTRSDSGQSRGQRKNPRGRGGNWGNRGNQALGRTRSTSDIFGALGDSGGANTKQTPRPVRDKTEICMYFIKGHCKHGDDKCYKAHDKMPYRWEVNKDDKWTAMPNNETIEKDYCDPKNSYSGSGPAVHFDTMTQGQDKVRRLSTMNSLLQPDFIHTTEWLWYWEDEFGKWNMYASAIGGHKPADMDSAKLEQKFLENDQQVVEFVAGSQSYSLSFQDMIQTNKRYSTKRLVKRRPRFVSAADVLAKKVRRPLGQASFTGIPDHWDKSQIPQTGYKRVSLQHTSDEFKEIEALFCQTVRGFDIVKIERIQNKALWEVYQWQKNQMKNNNHGRDVRERKLFHGTDSKFVDVICHTNFDWRICGTHGTAYGKGSYFARDAKYSHSYTGDSDVRSMFVARVLVGDYTKGSPDYRRPPSKDGGDINFFDSCVDDILTPSIFVVFEKHQIYPEYLLQYKTMHPLVSMYGAASTAAAAKPAVTPKPVVAPPPVRRVAQTPTVSVYQSSASSYQSRASSTQSSSSSYQPSASSYQSSASSTQSSSSSYQPSASSYQSSASSSPSSSSSYQPSTLSYQPSTSTYQYRTTNPTNPFHRSTLPAAPAPTPSKKSDSCVIA